MIIIAFSSYSTNYCIFSDTKYLLKGYRVNKAEQGQKRVF